MERTELAGTCVGSNEGELPSLVDYFTAASQRLCVELKQTINDSLSENLTRPRETIADLERFLRVMQIKMAKLGKENVDKRSD